MHTMWASMKAATNRRSFLKNGFTAAGVATTGLGLLANTPSLLAERGPEEHSGRLIRGDAALLRFAAAAESWRPIFGYNTTNLEESRTTSFLAEVGLATQHTQRHLRCSTPTWHSTFMTTQMMSSPTRIS